MGIRRVDPLPDVSVAKLPGSAQAADRLRIAAKGDGRLGVGVQLGQVGDAHGLVIARTISPFKSMTARSAAGPLAK